MPDEPRFLKDPPLGPDPSAPRKVWAPPPRPAPRAPADDDVMQHPALQRALGETAAALAGYGEAVAAAFERARWDDVAARAVIACDELVHEGVRIAAPRSWGAAQPNPFAGGVLWPIGDEQVDTVDLLVGVGLPRVPTRDEWLAMRARQLPDGFVIATARTLRHSSGATAYEHLELGAMARPRVVRVVRTLWRAPHLVVLTLAARDALPEARAIELAHAFGSLRLP